MKGQDYLNRYLGGKQLAAAVIIIFLLQWFLPLNTVWQYEWLRHDDRHAYQFRLSPIDPYDVFRGYYVRLHYAVEDKIYPLPPEYYDAEKGRGSQSKPLYAELGTDTDGFAEISALYSENGANRVAVEVQHYSVDQCSSHYCAKIRLPIDRYYLPKEAAAALEKVMPRNNRDKSAVVALTAHIGNGKMAAINLRIDGTNWQDYLQQHPPK